MYFVTQNPCDIPMSILGQLGNRVQHALRAYTPLDQKAVRTAAMTFRANPAFDTAEAITTLKTGEALVSFLDADGAPSIVERATILPPQSAMNAIDGDVRQECIESSPFRGVYDTPVDRVSAYEMLASAFQKEQMPAPEAAAPQISTAAPTVSRPDAFLVFDPQTGHYVQREAAQPMTQAQPAAQSSTPRPAWMAADEPARPAWQNQQEQQPIGQAQPVPVLTVQQPQVQNMLVMVYDPASGQYVQKMMPMQLDPATGNYVPAQAQAAAAPTTTKAQEREAEKQRKAAEKAEKERQAEERRKHADELREERAARARKNDSLLGRVQNTAISTATREVTRQVTRGILGGITGLFGGNKK